MECSRARASTEKPDRRLLKEPRERDGGGNGEGWWIGKLFRKESRQEMEVYLAKDREVPRMTPSSWLARECLLGE